MLNPASDSRTEAAIHNARNQVENLGWEVDEYVNERNESHLVLTRKGVRHGWGMFDRLYVWTQAYEALTGRHWPTLLPHSSSICDCGIRSRL